MRQIFIACIFFTGIYNSAQAQSPLNKQQTVDYIEKQYKAAYVFEAVKVISVKLENKALQVDYSEGTKKRFDLSNIDSVIIKWNKCITLFPSEVEVFVNMPVEADRKRLKKALEHLIEILKTEKSTDPFDN